MSRTQPACAVAATHKRETQAADGTCCAFGYGLTLSDCGGATDLAGAAGCCPSDWLLRYSLQPSGNSVVEDTSKIDCISFVAQASCAATGGFWTVDNLPNSYCPHTVASALAAWAPDVVNGAPPSRAVGLAALAALAFF